MDIMKHSFRFVLNENEMPWKHEVLLYGELRFGRHYLDYLY